MNRTKTEIPVGSLGQYATMLVVIGITISIGVLILLTMYDSATISPLTTYNQTTITLANSTCTALTYARGVDILAVGNMTTAASYGIGNFTMLGNTSGSEICVTGYPTFDAANAKWVQYTYMFESDSASILSSTGESLGVFGDWLVIIAIVIVAVVVLSLIKFL